MARQDEASRATAGGWGEISGYQWWILFVAWLGWVFDSMDSTLFAVVLHPSLQELLGSSANRETIGYYGGLTLSVFLVGWALGGVVFGVLTDYIGRARVLIFTILLYSLFTGLSALSHSWRELAVYRFLTALGIGGEWAAGAALVAETWPESRRALAAGFLQSAWAFGFFLTATINLAFGQYGWRVLFLFGIAPSLCALLVRMAVKEPQRWERVREAIKQKITLRELFTPALLRSTLVGSALAFVAVFGLWGATNWTPALVQDLLSARGELPAAVARSTSYALIALNFGAVLGYLSFAPIAQRMGRRAAFCLMFAGSFLFLQVTFYAPRDFQTLLYLLPVLGFFNNGVFSGFPIYFPELFPTRVRGTGCGFCFNTGRVLAAGGPLATGWLIFFMGSYTRAVSIVSLIYLFGMLVLIPAPETRGKALLD